MTRDEQRAACIEAMATATARMRGYNLQFMAEWFRKALTLEATAAFDAQHGLARVDQIEATEEMIDAGRVANLMPNPTDGLYERIWRAMSEAGDLTNGPGEAT